MQAPLAIISLRDVVLKHEGQLVMKDISLDILEGEFVFLIGKTGAGKSTILKALYADSKISSGVLSVAGYQLNEIANDEIPFLRRKLGIVFQDFQLLTDRSIEENFEFVMRATGWTDSKEISNKIAQLLERVHLPGVEKKYPHQLSGGEQQRITIARALINNPEIILADEPTGNLDPIVSKEILNLFIEINQEGTAILMGTHQHNFIQQYPNRVIYCENQGIKDIGKAQVIRQFGIS